MKKIIILLILNSYLSHIVLSQQMTITYDLFNKYSQIVLETVPSLSNYDIAYRHSLHIKSNQSVFRIDSLMLLKDRPQTGYSIFPFMEIFKDYKADLWLKNSSNYKEGYAYQQKISDQRRSNKFNWTKTGKEKYILGYKCIEVQSGNIKAFYSPSIPIADGPGNDIFGLSGLVLEFESDYEHWIAVSITYENPFTIEWPKLNTSSEESSISKSVFATKDLPGGKAIRIDSETPLNKWLRFDVVK